MNLFAPKPQKPTPLPEVDQERAAIEDQLRARMMKGRAATMLSAGGAAPTAQRQTLGN